MKNPGQQGKYITLLMDNLILEYFTLLHITFVCKHFLLAK